MTPRPVFTPFLALLIGAAVIAPPPCAQAVIPVVDTSAIAQAIRQVSLQLQQIQALQAQLTNQAAMLQKLGSDVTGPVTSIASQATSVLKQAQGLGYAGQSIAQELQSLYPTQLNGASFATTQAALANWRQTTRQTLEQALSTQNQIVQSQAATTGAVAGAVAASQSAPGETAAVQATNQLLVAVAAQLTQLQNLLITEARAQAAAAAEAQAIRAAGAADSQRFWKTAPAPARVQNPGAL